MSQDRRELTQEEVEHQQKALEQNRENTPRPIKPEEVKKPVLSEGEPIAPGENPVNESPVPEQPPVVESEIQCKPRSKK
jgi:hypothetical protein